LKTGAPFCLPAPDCYRDSNEIKHAKRVSSLMPLNFFSPEGCARTGQQNKAIY